ncbi:MAG TPA: hypothetical protein VGA15_17130 [Bradyrhizobium sp.]
MDPVFITRTIEATPFPSAPNVVISYPHREDWWHRYPALRKAGGRNRNIDEFQWLYQDSKRAYQDSVLKRLRKIQHWATGRAVLAELRARPSYSVYTFPWDFLPSIDLGDPRDLGMTETLRIPQTRRERARGIKPPGTKFRVRGVCYASMDKPGAVDVFYSDYRCEESDADGTLLHELVHAMRIISGVDRGVPMGGGYENSEEFYANTVEMIYRSERGQDVFDYAFHPINQASVLKQPKARALLTDLRYAQPSLFLALARVDAPFNPIRPIADQLLRIDL